MTITHDGFLVNARSYLDDVPPELYRVLANPESDEERLIYADWLDDHGEEERAEFIRVQVELERFQWARNVREADYDATDGIDMNWRRAFELHDAEMRILWKKHPALECAMWEAWCWAEARNEDGEPVKADSRRGSFTVTPHGSGGLKGNSCGCTVDTDLGTIKQMFRRGFVAEVHAPLAVLQQHLPALVQSHPIERVRATDKEPEFFEDLSNPWTWWRHGDRAGSIGSGLWAKLDGHVVDAVDSVSSGKDYPTAEAAHAALSDALLALARR